MCARRLSLSFFVVVGALRPSALARVGFMAMRRTGETVGAALIESEETRHVRICVLYRSSSFLCFYPVLDPRLIRLTPSPPLYARVLLGSVLLRRHRGPNPKVAPLCPCAATAGPGIPKGEPTASGTPINISRQEPRHQVKCKYWLRVPT